jgi:hypothetical protein
MALRSSFHVARRPKLAVLVESARTAIVAVTKGQQAVGEYVTFAARHSGMLVVSPCPAGEPLVRPSPQSS